MPTDVSRTSSGAHQPFRGALGGDGRVHHDRVGVSARCHRAALLALDPTDRLDRVTLVGIEPGRDAWTVGDEACVLHDTGVAAVRDAFLTVGPRWCDPE